MPQEVLLQKQDLLRRVHLGLLVQQQLEVLEALLLVEVDSVFRQSVHEEDVNLLLVQDARDLGEEPLERPHLLGVDLEEPICEGIILIWRHFTRILKAYKPGKQRRAVLLDACAEEARVGQLPVPLDGSVLARLHAGYHAARLLRRDVVHRLLVPATAERSEGKVARGHVVQCDSYRPQVHRGAEGLALEDEGKRWIWCPRISTSMSSCVPRVATVGLDQQVRFM